MIQVASMKRHPALITLSREHHDGLVIAQVLKSDVPAYRGMPDRPADRLEYFKARFVTALKPHFISEEQYLFPMLKGRDAGVDDLLNRLVQEHRELEAATRLAAGDPELESRLDATGRLLERHIRAEERELFQWAQEHLSESELQTLASHVSRS